MCAAVGQDLYVSWDEAIDNMVSWEPAFVPDADNHALYQRMSAIYDEVPSHTDKIFEESHKIFG
jgi:sugar (pentulose or hexulose) kinase